MVKDEGPTPATSSAGMRPLSTDYGSEREISPSAPVRQGSSSRGRSGLRRFSHRLVRHKLALTGAVLLCVVVVIALVGPMFSPSPTAVDVGNRLQAPGPTAWFGTDNYGRDVLARVVEGARVSLAVGAATALLTSVFGLTIGLYASYNRTADAVLMRIADALMAFPGILLAIAIMAALGSRALNVVIALTIVFTPYVARIVRSSALVVKEQTFIEALRSQGASRARVIWVNMAPNVLSPMLVQSTFIFADAIIIEAALSFLGAGVPPPAPSLGNMLLEGKTVIYTAWWMTLIPGIFLMATILAINLLGDGLRDLLDPTYRGTSILRGRGRRHASGRFPRWMGGRGRSVQSESQSHEYRS